MKGELAAIAAQYAEAALELAETADGGSISGGVADTVAKDLIGINAVLSNAPDLGLVLNHPALSPKEKSDLLLKTFEGRVHDLTFRLLNLLNDRRRLELLPELEDEYLKLLRERKNIVSARLVCAEALSDSEVADIKARLTEHLGKKLELTVEVDESLLGGAVLRLGDQVIDGSLRGKLQSIGKSLLAV